MSERRRILVCDDTPSIHDDFVKILSPKKASADLLDMESELFGETASTNKNLELPTYEIDHAYQGMEAIAMIQKAHEDGDPYNMVFMDVRMPPGIDGVEAVAKIWQMYPKTQVAICSAYSDYSWEKTIDNLGMSDRMIFLKKPFEAIEIQQLALAMTKKWQVEKELDTYVDTLEYLVEQKNKEFRQVWAKQAHSAKKAALSEVAKSAFSRISKASKEIESQPKKASEQIRDICEAYSVFSGSHLSTNEGCVANIKSVFSTFKFLCHDLYTEQGVRVDISEADPSFAVACNPSSVLEAIFSLINYGLEGTHEKKSIALSSQGDNGQIEVKINFGAPMNLDAEQDMRLVVAKSILETCGGSFDMTDANGFVLRFPQAVDGPADAAA